MRRFLQRDDMKLFGFCAGLALLFLWQGTLGGKVFAPLRLMFYFAPWHAQSESTKLPAWDVLVWDGVAQFYVWRDLVRSLWLNGEIPLWNPYQLGGMPLLANSQSAPFYVPHLLALPMPTWVEMGWLAWFHLTVAGVGIGSFLRRIEVGMVGAITGAGLWMFSTFFVSWLQMSSVSAVLCWYGWLLWGIEVVFARGWRTIGAIAIPAWLMLTAGHLQFALYGFLVTGGYVLWRVWGSEERALLLVRVGVAMLIAVLMAFPHWQPVLELAGQSHRTHGATESGYTAYVRNALPLFHLITFWFPNAYGHPREGTYWGAIPYAEFALGIGAVGLLLAGMGMARRGQGLFWAVWVGLAILVAVGSPLTRLLYFVLPGGSALGSPARILCLVAFGLAVLAGLGVEQRERWFQGIVFWLGGVILALGLAFAFLPQEVPREPLVRGVVADLGIGVLPFVLAFGVLLAIYKHAIDARLGLGLLVVMAILPLFAQGYRYPLYADRDEVFPPVAILESARPALGERIAVRNTRWSLYEPPRAILPPNTATAYRIADVAGYDSLILRHSKQMLDILNQMESAPVENGNMQFVKQITPALRWMRVERVLTEEGWLAVPESPAGWRGVYLGRAQRAPDIDTNEQWAQALAEAWTQRLVLLHGKEADTAIRHYGAGVPVDNGTVEWLEIRATRVCLRVSNPADQTTWLMVSDAWYPRWQARVDGGRVPLLRANLAFRAVPIPPGTHELEMFCQGTDLLIGFLLSLVLAVGLVGFGIQQSLFHHRHGGG